MRLEKASAKAIKYACINFHYAKREPSFKVGYSVFNEKNEWCGVICYGNGNINFSKPYGLKQGEVIELVRVALNGKQNITSKAVSISMRLIKKACPLAKILVSYADTYQNHKGVIYQALNWYYEGEKKSRPKHFCKISGKEIHDRNVCKTGYTEEFGKRIRVKKYSEVNSIEMPAKHKYIYPLDKSLIPLCKSLSKPYPKKETNAAEVLPVAHQASSLKEGFDSTLPLNKTGE
jgi:hypothetical protein